jgi:hypothetical protein
MRIACAAVTGSSSIGPCGVTAEIIASRAAVAATIEVADSLLLAPWRARA